MLKKVFGTQKPKALFPHLQRPTEWQSYKCRFALLGSAGAGKTTVADLILLTMQTMSQRDETFSCRVLEGTSDIEEGTSELRIGHFPPKTQPYMTSVIEAGFLLEFSGFWGMKRLHIPIADIAGEDITAIIKHKAPYAPSPEEFSRSLALVQDVRNADGFLVALPASRALLHHRDVQIERETGDLPVDPDVNLKRILSAIIDYKEQSHAKPIKAIACIITKWDLIAPYAAKWGMDVQDPSGQGLQNFMNICFPATSMALKSSHVQNIQFFPSFVQTEVDSQTGREKTWGRHPRTGADDHSPIIKVKPPNEWITYGRVPEYSAESYRNLINFLKLFAA
jgi:hypothetical protein